MPLALTTCSRPPHCRPHFRRSVSTAIHIGTAASIPIRPSRLCSTTIRDANSIIFADQMWHTSGPEPQSLEDVLSRQKDIQFASRDDSHIARQQDLHRLRHIVREPVKLVPEDQTRSALK